MRMLCFWDFIINNVKLKHEKAEKTQFLKNFEKKTIFSSNKNNVSGQIKVDSLQCSSWREMQIFLFFNFITKYIKLKHENVEETQFL